MLENQRDNLLAFAVELDRELAALAQEWQIRVTTAREVLQVQSLPTWDAKRWRREATLRETLRGRYHGVCADVQELSDRQGHRIKIGGLGRMANSAFGGKLNLYGTCSHLCTMFVVYLVVDNKYNVYVR